MPGRSPPCGTAGLVGTPQLAHPGWQSPQSTCCSPGRPRRAGAYGPHRRGGLPRGPPGLRGVGGERRGKPVYTHLPKNLRRNPHPGRPAGSAAHTDVLGSPSRDTPLLPLDTRGAELPKLCARCPLNSTAKAWGQQRQREAGGPGALGLCEGAPPIPPTSAHPHPAELGPLPTMAASPDLGPLPTWAPHHDLRPCRAAPGSSQDAHLGAAQDMLTQGGPRQDQHRVFRSPQGGGWAAGALGDGRSALLREMRARGPGERLP